MTAEASGPNDSKFTARHRSRNRMSDSPRRRGRAVKRSGDAAGNDLDGLETRPDTASRDLRRARSARPTRPRRAREWIPVWMLGSSRLRRHLGIFDRLSRDVECANSVESHRTPNPGTSCLATSASASGATPAGVRRAWTATAAPSRRGRRRRRRRASSGARRRCAASTSSSRTRPARGGRATRATPTASPSRANSRRRSSSRVRRPRTATSRSSSSSWPHRARAAASCRRRRRRPECTPSRMRRAFGAPGNLT